MHSVIGAVFVGRIGDRKQKFVAFALKVHPSLIVIKVQIVRIIHPAECLRTLGSQSQITQVTAVLAVKKADYIVLPVLGEIPDSISAHAPILLPLIRLF
jgi:hypothetical protein